MNTSDAEWEVDSKKLDRDETKLKSHQEQPNALHMPFKSEMLQTPSIVQMALYHT